MPVIPNLIQAARGVFKSLNVSGDVVSTGIVRARAMVAGMPGASATGRYVGATTTGAPTTGSFSKGDFISTQDGNMLACSVGGSPGTWLFQMRAFALGTAISGSPTTSQALLFQGGTSVVTTNGGGDATINFPTAFPNSLISVMAVGGDPTNFTRDVVSIYTTSSKTGFNYHLHVADTNANDANVARRIDWMAFGT